MSKQNRNKSVLSDELLLYTTKIDEPLSFGYEIECISLKAVTITLSFEGSENFKVEGKGPEDLTLTSTIRPFSRLDMGKIVLVDKSKRAMLKMNCEWKVEDPNDEETEVYLRAHRMNIEKVIKDAETLNFPPYLEDPNNRIINQICSTYGKPFVDLDFPPVVTSLYTSKKLRNVSHIDGGEDAIEAIRKKTPIEWKRARDFLTGDYDVFMEGIEPSDIRQGALGDCWFMCAVAALTEFPILISNLFPDAENKENRESGCYQVRICKNGLWKTVRVDDYFPCYPGGGPMYSRNHGNELWVLLLEKAYAKVHGSYEAIKSGWAYEGMMDLTGAPYETFRLDDPDVKARINSGELWETLKTYDQENFIMSASTPGEDIYTETGKRPGKENTTGLVAGHAYTLIAVKMTSKGDKLMKLRNPWGNMEWTGDWSDKSPLWTQQMQDEIEPLVDSDDGCFWMCLEDVLKYFYSINVCKVCYPGLNSNPWNEARRQFYFEYNHDHPINSEGNRITCPSYILTTNEPGRFFVSVHQEDIRCMRSKPYIDIGVSIMQVNPVYGTFTLVTGTGNSVERQNQTVRFDLNPGKYIIVPTTTGCKLGQYVEQVKAGTVQISANAEPVALIRTLETGELDFTTAVYDVYEEVFNRFDLDGDGVLNLDELNQYMLRTEGSPVEEKAYLWLLHNFEATERKGLSCTGFIRAQLFVFKRTGADEAKLREEMKLLGYDDQLKYNNGRGSVLVVHSSAKFSLATHTFDENAFKEALELPIMAKGDCSTFEDGKIKLYKYRSSYKGLSFVVENKHFLPLVFILDCSGSTNVISHRDTLSHQETIPPGQSRIMHHLMPDDDDSSGWAWSYSASYMWEED